MKAFPKDYETLFMFSEHTPFSCEAEASDFKSECPPDKKVKKEDLFKFKRGRGDLHVSVVTFGLAAFFLAFFWTETGWNTRKLPDEFGLYLAHQFGLVDLEGRGMRFGRILKQSWFAPMLCVLILVPTTIWNLRASWQVHRWRKRFLQPTGIGYELEKYAAALEFVGYFIGSPAMNLYNCQALSSNEVSIGSLKFKIKSNIDNSQSKELKLGIRSEFITVEDSFGDNTIQADINEVEDFGNYKLITAQCDEMKIKAKVKREQNVPSEKVILKFPSDRCCIYENNKLI